MRYSQSCQSNEIVADMYKGFECLSASIIDHNHSGPPTQATGPPTQATGPSWSGAGVGAGMLRGVGIPLFENKKVFTFQMFITVLYISIVLVFSFVMFILVLISNSRYSCLF